MRLQAGDFKGDATLPPARITWEIQRIRAVVTARSTGVGIHYPTRRGGRPCHERLIPRDALPSGREVDQTLECDGGPIPYRRGSLEPCDETPRDPGADRDVAACQRERQLAAAAGSQAAVTFEQGAGAREAHDDHLTARSHACRRRQMAIAETDSTRAPAFTAHRRPMCPHGRRSAEASFGPWRRARQGRRPRCRGPAGRACPTWLSRLVRH